VVGHHVLQRDERRVVEATEVVVEHVDAGHDTAGQVHKHRIGREPLDAEDPRLAHGERVGEQPQLRAHRVDDAVPPLEPVELGVQLAIEPDAAQVAPEPDEPGDAGHGGVRLAGPNALRVRPPDAASPLIAISTLASRHIPAHLGGARRSLASFHSKSADR
jgi:hypothetical protein